MYKRFTMVRLQLELTPDSSQPLGFLPPMKQALKGSPSQKQLGMSGHTEWTARDDLILMKSMEAGYALEALARGAMDLSRRFSLPELEERWRTLLTDPGLALDASRRMLAACGQAAVLGTLSSVPSFPSAEVQRSDGSPAQGGLRLQYGRARKRARKDAAERRRRLLLDPTFGDLYADDDDMSVGLADPGMPTPQDMNSLNGLEEPLLANLEAFEERIRGGGRSRLGGSRSWEAEIEDEQATRMRKRKELLGYHQAQHGRGKQPGKEAPSRSGQGRERGKGGTGQGAPAAPAYDLLVVHHEGEGEGQDAEGGSVWGSGPSLAGGQQAVVGRSNGFAGAGKELVTGAGCLGDGLGVPAWGEAGAMLGNGLSLGAGEQGGAGIERDMLQEMFSVLTGDMCDEDTLDTAAAHDSGAEQPWEAAGSSGAGGGAATEERRRQEGGKASPAAAADGAGMEAAEQDAREGEGGTGAQGRGGDGRKLQDGLLEVPSSGGERSGPELSFGLSDSAAHEREGAAHASTADRAQAPSTEAGDASSRGQDGEDMKTRRKEGKVAELSEEVEEGHGREQVAPSEAGPPQEDQDAAGAQVSERAGHSADGTAPPGDFRLAPPRKSSPWSTPRLGPQAAPPGPDLLPDLDALVPWSPNEKKRPAPSPLFNFGRGTGPSPTFTPLPGADATEELDFLPLPSAALLAPPGTSASRHLVALGEAARPSSSPALAPHARTALPPLAQQLQLMEEDTRSEPGDIARFRDRQLARTASVDAERPLGPGPGGRQPADTGEDGRAPGEEAGREAAGKAGSEDDAWNSEEEPLYFSDVEALVLDCDLEPDDETGDAARRHARRLQGKHRKAMLRLEQLADSATCRQLTRERALAVLYGRRLRYLIRDSEILVGRSTVEAAVDVDLAVEGAATKVSRKQASIKLKKDGNWYIKNLGKREFQVNNRPVEAGSREKLENKCLLEIGGLRLVFEINSKLVAKVLSRMPADL
ncbi:Forkhead-associated (FHA) domain-containing protein [Klebsormidium nitens]|uniref:Forkhead-associated (FHA) domain-containing protein n=1 Tax=Klebsormidium nitens TaxID=105231 RepID=A0A1Y1IM34_KLENI|nr:Forkhead-associated (FHA) domain-containing protein [Klebsormidium nitens]|eukprot:GAQ89178.1 Forkhead-associated (FHA) domain-containing protein [Klebsormidium nitens]